MRECVRVSQRGAEADETWCIIFDGVDFRGPESIVFMSSLISAVLPDDKNNCDSHRL